jgi:2-amino-4-hydroxy-6-hydroxymethyldihydropteridine diphosphokinase
MGSAMPSAPPPYPSRPAAVIALGLGGNLGGRGEIEAALRLALERLRESLGELHVASLYRGPAVAPGGGEPQPDFLNTAAVGRTALQPEAVLAIAKALEMAAGRRPGPRFGPRPLDVDLLLYGDLRSAAPELTLPHPRLAERRFVLAPLAEIAPDLPIPALGASPSELLRRLPPAAPPVERLPWSRAGHAGDAGRSGNPGNPAAALPPPHRPEAAKA